ncbi:MAG: endospore germination permease [Clostridiales bacterium]|nr:endospore germination permease [Clostridiales bacterium]
MERETLKSWNFSSIMFLFMLGTSISRVGALEQDMWISILIGGAAGVLLCCLYARILQLHPQMGYYNIAEHALGKVGGRIVSVCMIWYAVHVGANTLMEFSEFLSITSLHLTPMFVVLAAMTIFCAILARSGTYVFGKFTVIFAPVVILIFVFTFLFSINIMEPSNLQPVLNHSGGEIAGGALSFLTQPIGETVLLLPLAACLKPNVKPHKAYLTGFGVGFLLLIMVAFRFIVVVGMRVMSAFMFALFSAPRAINVGEVITRIEGITSITFCVTAAVKLCVCILAAAYGIDSVCDFHDTHTSVIPASMLILAFGAALYSSIVDFIDFLNVYPIYALPFQVILPAVVWIAAEIKHRRNPAVKPAASGGGTPLAQHG